MSKSYRISPKALEDMDRIWLYTLQNWSLNQANYYYRLVFQEIEFLARNFEIGSDIGFVKSGYKKYKVMSHFVIYRMANDGLIEIVRVLHQKMDIPNQL